MPNLPGNARPNPEVCCICHCRVPENQRVYEVRETGPKESVQRWTYCPTCAPPSKAVENIRSRGPGDHRQ